MRIILTGTYPTLERMLLSSAAKNTKYKKQKEPKGKVSDGEYCPKEKFGQSWAYAKGEKTEVQENVV